MRKTILLALAMGMLVSVAVKAQTQLWSMTSLGGSHDMGVVFKMNLDGTGYTVVYNFDSTHGSFPKGSLLKSSTGKLYGMTSNGGAVNAGVLFSINPNTNAFSVLYNFDSLTQGVPYGSLIQTGSGTKLYGMTSIGGVNFGGTIFSFDTVTNAVVTVHSFDYTDGGTPYGDLKLATDNKMYGMTYEGGANTYGVLFSFNPSNNAFVNLHDFDDATGDSPYGSLVQAANSKLYGMTYFGGSDMAGVIFSCSTSGSYTDEYDFTSNYPWGTLVKATTGKLYGMTYYGGSVDGGILFSYNTTTNNFDSLNQFDGINGNNPTSSLFQASNGKLYGMTQMGGSDSLGCIFSMDSSFANHNSITNLRNLAVADGKVPVFSNFIEVAAPAIGIITGSVSLAICDGRSITVPYTANGTYNNGNVFTAQLSNATGTFASPTTIGTLTSTTSGTINATIPSNTPTGTGYRIRVVSNNPVVTGSDNGTNITIHSLPTPSITPSGATSFCQGGSVNLDAGANYSTYVWSNSATTRIISATTSATFAVTVSDNIGCTGTTSQIVTVYPTYSSNVSASICQGNTYTFPDNTTSTVATVHTSHLSTIHTCDSAITTTLTVNPIYSSNVSASICQGDIYTFPDNTTSTVATIHTCHLSSVHTCDSAITTTLTVNPIYASNVSASICQGDIYTFPDNTTSSVATVHTSHLSTIHTCDSAITTTLTVNPIYSSNVSASICQGDIYTFPDNTTSTVATIHTSHLSSVHTCDSAITSTLTVNPIYASNVSASICQGDIYTFPDNTTSTVATIHTSHLSSIYTCDSTITITLTVNPIYAFQDTAIICNGTTFTFPDGSTTTTATDHTSLLHTITNCDSSIITHVVLITFDTSVTMVGNTLMANANANEYQWLDCSNMTPISNATNQTFTPISNGNYAVVVTDSICSDTSSCYHIFSVGFHENRLANSINISPNPNAGNFFVKVLLENNSSVKLKVSNLLGEIIKEENLTSNKGIFIKEINLETTNQGIYFLNISINGISINEKIIIAY